ncbi:MAG TPA: hypothetical protein VNQ33_01260 [Acidimicrobiales bacterium]|nr:hypothetical protein [Acidimicrobiales bacterium]
MRDGPPMARRVTAALLAAGLALVALGGCGSDEGTRAERAKAEQLQSKLDEHGLDIDIDTAVSLYGDDGGKVCAVAKDPAAMEREGLLAHPRFALRRLHVTKDAAAYTEAVITVYCPDQLGNVRDYIDGLRVADEN